MFFFKKFFQTKKLIKIKKAIINVFFFKLFVSFIFVLPTITKQYIQTSQKKIKLKNLTYYGRYNDFFFEHPQ